MINRYTAIYTRIDSGYMGQLAEWPEVITEAASLDECRGTLDDALAEIVAAQRQLGQDIPKGGGLLEQIAIQV